MQKILGLSVRPLPGETSRNLSFRRDELKKHSLDVFPRFVTPEKMLSDMLKRHGKRIMSDMTECDSAMLPAQMARLDDWREIVGHHLRHELAETPEAVRTGEPLTHAFTLADFLAAAEITRRQHRAPAFINSRDEQLEKIFAGIDQIAGLIAKDSGLVNFLAERGQL